MFFVEHIGLTEYQRYFAEQPQIANRAASLAINQSVERKAIPISREHMLRQVAFPPGYLREKAGRRAEPRFGIKYKASPTSLVSAIAGRFAPTSLARFVTRRNAQKRSGVSVRINPGSTVALPRAFLVGLRSGNLGLAIRLRPGEVLSNTIGAKIITTGPMAGLALLYGPSVEQVFRSVSLDIEPDVLLYLQTEFLRQYDRLSRERSRG
jgi:hypothetical protein